MVLTRSQARNLARAASLGLPEEMAASLRQFSAPGPELDRLLSLVDPKLNRQLRPDPSAPSISLRHVKRLEVKSWSAALAFVAVFTLVALLALVTSWFLLVPAWCAAEAVFLVWYMHRYMYFNTQPKPHEPLHDDGDMMAVFNRLIKNKEKVEKYTCIKKWITTWFWGTPLESINRHNVAELLAYGFLYKSIAQLEAEGLGHLPMEMVLQLEEAWGLTFSDAPYEPKPFMSHLWQHVRCNYRPFVFYAGIEVIFLCKHLLMLASGFKYTYHEGFYVYTYGDLGTTACNANSTCSSPKRSSNSGTAKRRYGQQQADFLSQHSAAAAAGDGGNEPFVFLHGVGFGVLPYLGFVHRLVATGRPVIALEVRHLSMRLCNEVPEVDTIAKAVVSFMDRVGVPKAHVVAHSYGTFTASRVAQRHPARVASLTLLDPVCFLMFTGKLINNFVYMNPLQGGDIISWFVARHQTHAVSVCRRFYWSLLNLWCDQLPEHTLIVLAGEDKLVPADEVMTMLQHESQAHLLYHPTHGHADFLLDMPWQTEVAEQVALMADIASGIAPPSRDPRHKGFRVSVACSAGGGIARGYADSASSIDVLSQIGSAGAKLHDL